MPENEGGISKLKMLDSVELTVPFNEVPAAVPGEELLIGMIR
jgi:hypothetical protein